MTGLPPKIAEADTALAASHDGFMRMARERAELLREKLKAFDELLDERRRIRDELAMLEVLLGERDSTYVRFPSSALRRRRVPSSEDIVADEFAKMSVAEAAHEVLRREHGELFTGELVARLKAGGRSLSKKTPSSQVNASIRGLTDVFYMKKERGKAKWGLVEWKKDGEEGGDT